MFLPQFNFLEESFSRIGHKVAKTCESFHIKSPNFSKVSMGPSQISLKLCDCDPCPMK